MSKLRLDPPIEIPGSSWFKQLFNRVRPGPFMIRGYTVATLPVAAEWSDNDTFSSIIYVVNETGGPTIAFTDGTSWRRCADRAIVS